MSNRELAKSLIDQIPENKLFYIIPYLQGAAVPDELPSSDTLDALAEAQEMIDNGTGEHFSGTTQNFLSMLMEG